MELSKEDLMHFFIVFNLNITYFTSITQKAHEIIYALLKARMLAYVVLCSGGNWRALRKSHLGRATTTLPHAYTRFQTPGARVTSECFTTTLSRPLILTLIPQLPGMTALHRNHSWHHQNKGQISCRMIL